MGPEESSRSPSTSPLATMTSTCMLVALALPLACHLSLATSMARDREGSHLEGEGRELAMASTMGEGREDTPYEVGVSKPGIL